MTTSETTYSVSYRAPSTADESTRNTLDTEPTEGVTLNDVIEICRVTGAEAELRNPAGFTKGFVCPDGNYALLP